MEFDYNVFDEWVDRMCDQGNKIRNKGFKCAKSGDKIARKGWCYAVQTSEYRVLLKEARQALREYSHELDVLEALIREEERYESECDDYED